MLFMELKNDNTIISDNNFNKIFKDKHKDR